ncbi:hypothetical protein HYQ46_010289 [Verticillium longisporum]|nr:hypothetical protein HYQ46_010289 [Verticillium longisporum]
MTSVLRTTPTPGLAAQLVRKPSQGAWRRAPCARPRHSPLRTPCRSRMRGTAWVGFLWRRALAMGGGTCMRRTCWV